MRHKLLLMGWLLFYSLNKSVRGGQNVYSWIFSSAKSKTLSTSIRSSKASSTKRLRETGAVRYKSCIIDSILLMILFLPHSFSRHKSWFWQNPYAATSCLTGVFALIFIKRSTNKTWWCTTSFSNGIRGRQNVFSWLFFFTNSQTLFATIRSSNAASTKILRETGTEKHKVLIMHSCTWRLLIIHTP